MRADEKRTRLLTRERSGGLCEVCLIQRATNASHRKARSQGGLWSPANVVDACGSGTTGCHGWIEHNPEAARRLGLRLRRDEDPLVVPVDLARLGRVVLDDDGGWASAFNRASHEVPSIERATR